jgi:NADH-quinone oxidoreductase subunit A
VLAAFLAALIATAGMAAGLVALRLWHAGDDASRLSWSHAVPVIGGHEPETHAWSRFHARYYPMTIVLIAFEMEMMFMYPWAVVYVEVGVTALVEMGIFLLILSLGILYAWREGVFGWQ